MLLGGCHCGAVRFRFARQETYATLCHCTDCRRQSGAPFLAWTMIDAATLSVEGEPRVYASSAGGRRSFCGQCGTGLFFTNPALEGLGMIQVRIAALDEPQAVRPGAHVQVADRIDWVEGIHRLPAYERFPA